ncbi:hypothetical protein DITRI_Ditri14bG0084400 [Diplodiscus trichospermus]
MASGSQVDMDLVQHVAALEVANDEEEEMKLMVGEDHQHQTSYELCLVRRFLTDKALNFNVMRDRITSIWCPVKGVNIKEVSLQLYIFQFFHTLDLKRVIEGRPWSYDNHLLVLHKLAPGEVSIMPPLVFVEKEWGPWLRVPNRRGGNLGSERWLKEEYDKAGLSGGSLLTVTVPCMTGERGNKAYTGSISGRQLQALQSQSEGQNEENTRGKG